MKNLVGAAGLEPATPCLEGRCSIRAELRAPVEKSLYDDFSAPQCAITAVQAGGSLAGNDSSPASSTSSRG
jgi:hypothetical protein